MPIPAGVYVSPEAFVALSAYRPPTTALVAAHLRLDDWAANAVAYNGTEWWATGFDGWWGGSSMRTGATERPSDHGGFDGPSYLGPRTMTISGVTLAPTTDLVLLARDTIVSLCSDLRSLYPLVVTETSGLTRQCMVRIVGDPKVADLNETAFEWQMSLVAPDPRRYSTSETVLTMTAPADPVGGLVVPFSVPFSIVSVGSSSTTETVTNGGTFGTRPVITFSGPLSNPQITNVTTGQTMALTSVIAGGEWVVLDFDRRSVLLNGITSRASTILHGSAWWELAPGVNELQLAAADGEGSATVRFRSAWR